MQSGVMTSNTKAPKAHAASKAIPFYASSADACLSLLASSTTGLSAIEAARRLAEAGPNLLPQPKLPGLLHIFVHQFLNPLIYILLFAAVLSVTLGAWADAVFIAAVLLLNAVIGAAQEHHAQRSADALKNLIVATARVERGGEAYEIDARELVEGDVVLLESGTRVPADLRLFEGVALEVDESILTGESAPVMKNASRALIPDTPLPDRVNMAFAGTLCTRGRARGLVTATAQRTELGKIAGALGRAETKPPLVQRMERFTLWIGIAVGLLCVAIGLVAAWQGMPLNQIFILVVALAVSAIPEGLPVAMTVALAIGARRMARRHVIIRKLVAVEALGSCTAIAADKTGTLTLNELTVKRVWLPGERVWEVTGEGMVPEGRVVVPAGIDASDQLTQLAQAMALANEGFLGRRDSGWVYHGDPVDVALLVFAHKTGVTRVDLLARFPQLAAVGFESDRMYAASVHTHDPCPIVVVKGAVERLLPMCQHMHTATGEVPLDSAIVEQRAMSLASDGYRVLAIARGDCRPPDDGVLEDAHLSRLSFLGLVGMIDPARPEAPTAIADCRAAGIDVAMITGDHPETALAVARTLGLAQERRQVVTGRELREASSPETLDVLTARARVFARVAPEQKLAIVQSFTRRGHFIAMTGDGVNDAPALRVAHVGVAMGKKGTDVAREVSDIILTDDNFASIVAGVEEGRVAYGNVRKVTSLLVATGAAELVLFMLALLFSVPLPLLAVQLLWLNLVTNGIQDVALAFEPAEGNEMRFAPRPPRERIFNPLMIQRTAIAAAFMGLLAFTVFYWLLQHGWAVDAARNQTLLLMVLFENVHVFNCRSETQSAFGHSPLRNPILLVGTVAAQGIHIAAMYTPGLGDVLAVAPVTLEQWSALLLIALGLLGVMEIYKLLWRRRTTHASTASSTSS